MLARSMVDHNFRNTKSARRGENRNKPMQFTVETDFMNNIPPKSLQPAIVVVEQYPRQPTNQPVEHPGRNHLVPGVMARLLPTTSHITILAKAGQQLGDFCRIILQIAIECNDPFSPGGIKTSGQGGRLVIQTDHFRGVQVRPRI